MLSAPTSSTRSSRAGMLQSGVLLKEIDELIRGLRTEGADGELKSRICALIFLISQIPSRTIGGETGLRATAPFLADLLVRGPRRRRRPAPQARPRTARRARRRRPAHAHRRRVPAPDRRGRRVGEGLPEPARRHPRRRRSDEPAPQRATHRCGRGRPRRTQAHARRQQDAAQDRQSTGARTNRSLGEGDVPVWIRDEWSVTESSVKKSAAEAGDESPIVFVLLPKHEADQIKDTLASYAAAEDTLRRPTPQTDEGKAAQRAMKTRLATDDERLTALFQEVVARARVFQGGGAEVTTSTLRDAVETAANRSLIRLFPKFGAGDNANWGKVVIKARDGAPDALEAVGHHGEPTTNAVCKEVLAADQRRRHQGRRAPEALRRAALRLAQGRRQRRDPHAARRRQHPSRPGRQGPGRAQGAAPDPDRQGHALQGGRAADRRPAPGREGTPHRRRHPLRARAGRRADPGAAPAAQGSRRSGRRSTAAARATGHGPPRRSPRSRRQPAIPGSR